MKVNNVELEVVAGRKDQLPNTDKLEVAFAGKSNVGKSSLINCLINRKALARTSSSPGKTQTIKNQGSVPSCRVRLDPIQPSVMRLR